MELEISYLQFHVLLLKSGAFIRKLQVGVVRCGFFFFVVLQIYEMIIGLFADWCYYSCYYRRYEERALRN